MTYKQKGIYAAISTALVGVVLLTVPRYVVAPHQNTQVNACINNLRRLDGATEQWQLENGRSTNALPTLAEAGAYLKSPPVCPSGGTYRFDPNSGLPTCSVPGHVLP